MVDLPIFKDPPAPFIVNDSHVNDDVDVGDLSHHHTLGPKPGQAAAGNHSHQLAAFADPFHYPVSPKIGDITYNYINNTIDRYDGTGWYQINNNHLVTSTTRPAFCSPGHIIYETDTGTTLMLTSVGPDVWTPVGLAAIDTGWLTITPNTGWSGTAQVRSINGSIHCRGSMTRSSGTNTTFGQWPGAIRPSITTSASFHIREAGVQQTAAQTPTGAMVIGGNYTTGNPVYVDGWPTFVAI